MSMLDPETICVTKGGTDPNCWGEGDAPCEHHGTQEEWDAWESVVWGRGESK